MTTVTDSGSFLRRSQDFPVLVVSQDYELFFGHSGSIEKCLFEPCDLLVEFAAQRGIYVTFFVDAGMLCCMERLAPTSPSIDKALSKIKQHIESLVAQGHELGLHIHPHWEDTRWTNDVWDFSGTRYQLCEFSDNEISDIVARYAGSLKPLCDGAVRSYRAGGFCVEPFSRIREPLLIEGIDVDSSVVPGARLDDEEKGFDFRKAPDAPWWFFDDSPLNPCPEGEFLEIPITPQRLSLFHYWGRAVDRVLHRQPAAVIGDGTSKTIGRREILRRLAGASRTSELSMDGPKSAQLNVGRNRGQARTVWQVMGHPKLLGKPSLKALEEFIRMTSSKRFETVSGLARAIRSPGSNTV